MHEKRAHSRSLIRIAVTCTTEGGAVVAGTSHDLSTGGMYIEAGEIPAFGTKLGVEIDASGLRGVHLPGIVRWTKPSGFGVQFQLIGARETHALAELVRKGTRQ